ncbi:MAG: hypothetical protein ACRC30_15730 [Clostridium sp.]
MLGALLAFVIIIIAILILGIKNIKSDIVRVILFIILFLLEIFCLGKFSLVGGMKTIDVGFTSMKGYSFIILGIALVIIVLISIVVLIYTGKKSIDKRKIKKRNKEEIKTEIIEKIYEEREYERGNIEDSEELEELLERKIVIIKNFDSNEYLSINRKQKKVGIIKKEIEKNKIDNDYFEEESIDKYILEIFEKEKVVSYKRLENSYIDIDREKLLKVLKNLVKEEKISMIIEEMPDCSNRKFEKYKSILS